MGWTNRLTPDPALAGVEPKLKSYCRYCGQQALKTAMSPMRQPGGKINGYKCKPRCALREQGFKDKKETHGFETNAAA